MKVMAGDTNLQVLTSDNAGNVSICLKKKISENIEGGEDFGIFLRAS